MNSMKTENNKILSILLILLLTYAFIAGVVFSLNKMTSTMNTKPIIEKGAVVIDDNTFDDNKVLNFSGEWNFYPNTFITPNDLVSYEGDKGIITLPGFWNDNQTINTNLGKEGYATFSVDIINAGDPKKLKMHFSPAGAESYSVYVDETLVFETGTLGKTKDEVIPKFDAKTISIDLVEEATITMHVSSYSYVDGGFDRLIILGLADDIDQINNFNKTKDILLIGAFSMFSIIFFFLWLKTKRINQISLFSMLMSLFTVCYILSSNQMLVNAILPNVPFEIYSKMFHMVSITGSSMFLILLNELYPKSISKHVILLVEIKMIVFTAALILMDGIYNQFFLINGIPAILECTYGTIIIAKLIKKKSEGATLIMFGTATLISLIIYDVLYLYTMMFSPYELLIPIGIVIFLISFIGISVMHYERSLVQVQVLSDKNMEEEMQLMHARMNPHFIFNTLNSIAACCYEDGEKAADIIFDLADYMRQSFNFDYSRKLVTLSEEIELCKVFLTIEKTRFGDKLDYKIDVDATRRVNIPPFIVQTLVENAVRHGIRKKSMGGTVKINGYIEDEKYFVEIIDTGVGIKKEDIPKIISGQLHTGTGIGLAYVGRCMKKNSNLSFDIYSEEEKYTKVTIAIGLE
jgi:two-component system, LytTR family, sensor kinase